MSSPHAASNQPTSWRPLLEGAEREQVLQVVRQSAEALKVHTRSTSLPPGLSGGTAGLALFFAWLHRVQPADHHEAESQRLLQESMEAVSAQPLSAALFPGFTGVAWVVEHLQGGEPAPAGEEDPLQEVDEALVQHLETTPWPGDLELVSGLAGMGVYALERLSRPSAVQCLEHIVARLAEKAQSHPEGISWWRRKSSPSSGARVPASTLMCDLGVAHGMPGIMAVLAGAASAGVAVEESRRLLRGAWDYLMAQRLPHTGARFPDAVGPERKPRPTRSAWCYGDPGVALALHGVARALGEARWEAEALAIACEAALRPVEETGVVDAGLCHGTAGLAHIYNRLFQATGRTELAAAARRHVEHTLRLWKPGQGLGGFLTQVARDDGGFSWEGVPGLLTGVAGIGLALLAAVSAVEPSWDRSLLMSLRPQRML